MSKDHTSDSGINNYIETLNVSNVLSSVDLNSLNNQSNYINPDSIREQSDKDSLPNDDQSIPGIPPLPAGSDPKKICPFCQKTFSHPGSMGRHLDLKKGSRLHPAELIDKLRSDVKRRGNAEEVKQRRRIRARKYIAREEVKQRIKIQRRIRDKFTRNKNRFIIKFFNNLGKPNLNNHPTFPRLVLFFLSPTLWPHDPPTLETYRLLCSTLNERFLIQNNEQDVEFYNDVMLKVHTASENWLTLTDSIRQDIWIRELRRAAEDALTNISLFDLSDRDNWVVKQAKKRIENGKNKDGNDTDDTDSDSDDNDNSNNNEEDDNDGNDDDNDVESNINKPNNDTSYYNHEELAAVAEAVVNNSQNRNENVNLDPELLG